GLYEMEHDARLVMDESTFTKDEKPSEKPVEKPGEKPSKPSKKPEKPQAEVLADKTYDIDYTVMHEKESKPSIADPFFEKPGKMLVKDGIYYLQVTINKADWSMIKNLTIDGKE